MTKEIGEYILTVTEVEGIVLVSIMEFNNTKMKETYYTYDGDIGIFKYLSDSNLIKLCTKLLEKPAHSKFKIKLGIDIDCVV